MNIFYLDHNPIYCAKYHCDKHVIAMIKESAQLLCTAIRIAGGKETEIIYPNGKKKKVWLLSDETYDFKPEIINSGGCEIVKYHLILSSGLYVQTHINHPCSIWIRESYANWSYVFNLMFELQSEWQYRFHDNDQYFLHKSVTTLSRSDAAGKAMKFLDCRKQFTKPALCMPDEFKCEDAIMSYRNLYKNGKTNLHSWTKRKQPHWL